MKTGMTSIRKKSWLLNIARWFDSYAGNEAEMTSTQFNWVRVIPFLLLHLACFAALWTGVSTVALATCLGLFWLRMFAITAFYHRYFAHRSYKTNRFWQFIFALLGNMSAQRGPLWWAAHHRAHHQHADTEQDLHSPVQRGFWWSHMGWFTCDASFKTQLHRIKDFARFPELKFLDRYDSFAPPTADTHSVCCRRNHGGFRTGPEYQWRSDGGLGIRYFNRHSLSLHGDY